MRASLLLLTLVLCTTLFSAETMDMNQLRTDYYASIESEKKADELYKKLNNMKGKTAEHYGFVAALEALKAKHAWSPYTKLEWLGKSEKSFEFAVKLSPANLEIRFLRYTVEYYVPGFLGYSKHLTEDKKVIVQQLVSKNFGSLNKELIKKIGTFMLEKAGCTDDEKKKIKAAIQ